MTNPLVSVVIPAYNHENYIVECLKSVVDQNYGPIEIIVVDDGSSDETAEIAHQFLKIYAPSSIVIRKENAGAANAINYGISLSRGKFINILNSDDFFGRSRISFCVDVALRSGREFIYTGVNFVDAKSKNSSADEYILSILKAELATAQYPSLGFALMRNQLAISTGNFFFTRALFDRVGNFRNYLYVHDWDFILRSLFYAEPLAVPQKLYNYRFHGENSFKSLENIAGYETSEIMRNFLWLMTNRKPLNGRAPCPAYWPGLFEKLINDWNYHIYLPPRHRNQAIQEVFLK